MQAQPGDAWANGLASIDTSWLTRGSKSPHSLTTAKSMLFWGAILAWYVMSRNSFSNPTVTTACSNERVGGRECAKMLKALLFGEKSCKIAIDGDTKIIEAIQKILQRLQARLCSGLLLSRE